MKADNQHDRSRRGFIKSTALVAGTGLMGACAATESTPVPPPRNELYPLIRSNTLAQTAGPKGLLFSQIGYDIGYPMRVVLRLPEKSAVAGDAHCHLLPVGDGQSKQAPFAYWGALWDSHWWVADFGLADTPGEWNVQAIADGAVLMEDRGLRVGKQLLWEATAMLSSVDMLDRRKHFTKVGAGWQDAGTLWVESCAQSAMIIGLHELLEQQGDALGQDFKNRIYEHLTIGCDYHVMTHDKALALGYAKGAISHDLLGHENEILPRDAAYAVIALLKTAQALPDQYAERKKKYFSTALSSYAWLKDVAKPINQKGFSHLQRGIPDGTIIPEEEWATRDLVAMCWGSLALWQQGNEAAAKARCEALAKQIIGRQVSEDSPEAGYYGHFREYGGLPHTENAWTHAINNGEYGTDLGGIYPNYLMPLLEMLALWPGHPDAPLWKTALRRFAYGYLIPVCQKNPFLIVPLGIFGEAGPVWFAGPFHGTNTIYGYTAALAMALYKAFDEPVLRDIATANVQWLAGLNAGITKENMKESVVYSTDVPEGLALPSSMVCGIGNRWAGSWFQTRGVICNGFSVGKQFKIDTLPNPKNDGPFAFTDEDWIPHSAGWITALSRM